jgi:hypothetical protein
MARTVDEAKEIRDDAVAMKAYARQARNKDLLADATAIQVPAEIRVGELMEAQRRYPSYWALSRAQARLLRPLSIIQTVIQIGDNRMIHMRPTKRNQTGAVTVQRTIVKSKSIIE